MERHDTPLQCSPSQEAGHFDGFDLWTFELGAFQILSFAIRCSVYLRALPGVGAGGVGGMPVGGDVIAGGDIIGGGEMVAGGDIIAGGAFAGMTAGAATGRPLAAELTAAAGVAPGPCP
jgi:hypothetical protein